MDLSVNNLLSLSPYRDEIDIVTDEARKLFLNLVQTQDCENATFFPEVIRRDFGKKIPRKIFPFQEFATSYVAQALIKVADSYKYSEMLDEEMVRRRLEQYYLGVSWKKIGFTLYTLLYPDIVKDSETMVSFRDYINEDGVYWAEKILAKLQEPAWMKTQLSLIVKGQSTGMEYQRDMSDLFVKIHLLDPQSVIPAYNILTSLKGLPSVHLDLITRNYLGKPFPCEDILSDVEKAVHKPFHPRRASMISLDDINVYYGLAVDDFITCECQKLGFWTGTRPDNQRTLTLKERCPVL